LILTVNTYLFKYVPVKLGFIILSLIGVLRIPEEFYLYKDKDNTCGQKYANQVKYICTYVEENSFSETLHSCIFLRLFFQIIKLSRIVWGF
jgi:hypothetical protein